MEENNKKINYIAKQYYSYYNKLKNNYNKANYANKMSFMEYVENLMKNKYTVKGRLITEKEQVENEIYLLNKVIEKDYSKVDYVSSIIDIYNLINNTPLTDNNIDSKKRMLNEINCLLNKIPPFLDIICQECIKYIDDKEGKKSEFR